MLRLNPDLALDSCTSASETAPVLSRKRINLRWPAPSDMLLALIVILVGAYFVPRGPSWNGDTHMFLTASIVDRGTVNIDPFAALTGDRAFFAGHYYADKAPGLSLLAVPVYLVLKYALFHGASYLSLVRQPAAVRVDFLFRYCVAVVLSAVPTGMLAALIARMLRRMGLSAWQAAGVGLLYGLGTPALAFSQVVFSHQLTAALIFGGFTLLYGVRHGERAAMSAALAGLCMGWAMLSEYPTGLLVVAVVLYALARRDTRRTVALYLGAGFLPPLLVGAAYNWIAFGSPLALGYSHLAGPKVFQVGQAQGFFGVTVPHLDALWQTTLGPYRGLFLLSPVLLLCIPGFVLLARRVEWKAEWWLWLGMAGSYWLFSISYFAWDGGYSLGPRQFLPALPYLVLPLGEFVRVMHGRRRQALTVLLGVFSVGSIVAAAAVNPLESPTIPVPMVQWVLAQWIGFAPSPSWSLTDPRFASALRASLPWFPSAHLNNNWGMLWGLPGGLQLVPLALVVGGTYLLFACTYWLKSQRDTLPRRTLGVE